MPWLGRFLGRNRVFAIAASFSIALAVGANAAIFSIVDALWFRSLPIHEPGRVVVPYRPVVHTTDGEVLDHTPAQSVSALRKLDVFSAVAFELATSGLMALWEPVVLPRDGRGPLSTAVVSHNYFSTLGVAVTGRGLTEGDETSTVEVPAVISHAAWLGRFGGDPAIVGRTIETSSAPLRIVGIADPKFHGARLGDHRDLWLPVSGLRRFTDIQGVAERFMPVTIYARLRDGVSIEAALAPAKTILDRRTALRSLDDISFPLRSTGDLTRQSAVIRVLWTAAILVLVLGCANLAALVIARSEAQRHELAVRRCLGATPRQLLAQALGEAMALCAMGLSGGLLLRWWLLEGIGDMRVPAGMTVRALDLGLDIRVLLFAGVVSVIATAIAAAGAIRAARRADLARLMAAAPVAASRGTIRVRQTLLGAHVALCTALLGCGAALTWNIREAMRVDLGYASARLLSVNLRPRLSPYSADADTQRLARDLEQAMERVRQLPDVEAAGWGSAVFNSPDAVADGFVLVGDREVRGRLALLRAGSDYLAAIGARFVAGRDLGPHDERTAVDPMEVIKRQAQSASTGGAYTPPRQQPSAVVDIELAGRLWPGKMPVGQVFRRPATGVQYQVVGVIAPIRHTTSGPHVSSVFEMYPPGVVDMLRPQHAAVRMKAGAADQRAAVSTALREYFPEAPQLVVRDTASLIAEERARERIGAAVFSGFGVAAAFLGLIGTYGLVAFLMLRHRRELGIRAALGATRRQLLSMVTRRAILPSIAGAVAGLVLAYWVSRSLASVVAGVSSLDYWPAALSAITLACASAVTAVVAAIRARTISPSDLLRAE